VADKFAAEGIKVVAVSVDDREKTEALVEKYKLSFPVAYGADARAVSAATGAFVNDDPIYLQTTDFVLNPEGRRFLSSSCAMYELLSGLTARTLRHQLCKPRRQ
jgi:peroxiredoxin